MARLHFDNHYKDLCTMHTGNFDTFEILSPFPETNILWTEIYSQVLIKVLHGGLNTLRPRQNGRHFPDDIFKCIFLNENVSNSIKISLKFVPKGPINNSPSLIQIMDWRRPSNKPLSEPIMVNLPTHICVTQPQWVNEDVSLTYLKRKLRNLFLVDWWFASQVVLDFMLPQNNPMVMKHIT